MTDATNPNDPTDPMNLPEREATDSRLLMTWQWLRKQPLPLLIIRMIDQLSRRLRGVSLQRYSQITPQLHVGGQHDSRGLTMMQARGITAILNLRREFDYAGSGRVLPRYLHLPVEDNTAPTQAELVAGVRFITEELAKGGGVYIHCGVGVGRAPTLAAAYLVSTGMTPAEAWRQIRLVRPFIWPNRRQRRSIEQFAAEYQATPE
jgi:protein tyrosine phosphatase (PTP) superfamily phosphohydrolase (DUF442 family)